MKEEFYKMFPMAWNDGVFNLTLEQEGAFLQLCNYMYLRHGPVPNDVRLHMTLFRCGNVRAVAMVKALIAAGKIEVTEEGLVNHRVLRQLEERSDLSATRSAVARKRGSASRVTDECQPSDSRVDAECQASDTGVNSAKSLKNNDPDAAIAAYKEKEKEEEKSKTREEEKETRATRDGADAPSLPLPEPDDGWPKDAFERFWATYPNKVGKKAVEKKFEALRRSRKVAWDVLWSGLMAYVNKRDDRPWCNPETWLNQERWTDQPASGLGSRPSARGRYYSP